MVRKTLFASWLILLFLPVAVLYAQDDEGRVIDDVVREDVTLFNESLAVGETGLVSGNVTLFNGDATIQGTINGDLVVFNGDVIVSETAVVRGECVSLNGTVSAPEATTCIEVNEFPFASNFMNSFPDMGASLSSPRASEVAGSGFGALFGALALGVMMGFLAAVVFAIAPAATQRVDNAMREQPAAAISVGILSFIAIPFINLILLLISTLLIIVCVGLLGFPLVLAISLGFVTAGAWSVIVWGKRLGQSIADRLDRDGESVPVVAFGTAVLTFCISFLLLTNPFTAIVASLIASVPLAWGMGATALTRFGTRPFPYRNPVVIPSSEKITAVLETLDE